jgi:hypothetical protein
VKTLHNRLVWASAVMFGEWGYPVATEVGLPGGRADLLVFAKGTRLPRFVIDVKTTDRGDGVGQVLSYARWFGAQPVLLMTLGNATSGMRTRCRHMGIQVMEIDGDSILGAAERMVAEGARTEWVGMDFHYHWDVAA